MGGHSKAATARGDWVDPTLAKATVAQMAEIWLKTKAAAQADHPRELREHLAGPRAADMGLDAAASVTPSSVAGWVGELTDTGISASSARMALLSLKQILDLAVQDGRLAKNPAAAVKSSRLPRAKPRFLTHDNCSRSRPRAEGRAKARGLCPLAGQPAYGGASCVRSDVKHLDLAACRLSVEDNLPDRHRPDQIVTPKGHQSRTVPFPKHLREMLAQVVAGKGRNEFVFGSATASPST